MCGRTERCVLCGEMIAANDPDAVEVGGGLAHGECIEEHDDEPGLFGEQDPDSAGRGAAFECSVAELAIQRARRRSARRKAG